MKYRDALFAIFAIALTLFSLTGIAAGGQDLYGAAARAQSDGFDALAHQVFGVHVCSVAATS